MRVRGGLIAAVAFVLVAPADSASGLQTSTARPCLQGEARPSFVSTSERGSVGG